MAAVQIFRDAPIVASKVRSIGAMPNRLAVNPDGLNVTINTDDPSISKINLSSEYQAVHKDLGISMDRIGTRVKAAAQAAFLPAGLREKLSGAIETEFMRKLILPD